MLRFAVLLSLLLVLTEALPRLEFDNEGNLINDGLSLFRERRANPQPLVTGSAVREPEGKPGEFKKVLHIIHHPPVQGAVGNTATMPKVGLIR